MDRAEIILDETEREVMAAAIVPAWDAASPHKNIENQKSCARLRQILMDWRREIILRDKV